MEEIRRRQLIEATIDCLHQHGFSNTTLQTIGRQAGVSPGLVAHYFRDKEGLLEATLRSLATSLGRQVATAMRRADTPKARVQAIIETNLSPDQFDRRIAIVWLAFWGQVSHSPRLWRVQRIYERRLFSNLRHGLKQMLPPAEAERLAEALAALIDGLWLRATLSGEEQNGERARRIALDFLDTQLADRITQAAS
jgi:transcriptional repressor BetI